MADAERDAFEAEMAQQTPYGIHPYATTSALAPISQAAQTAAANLLNKALDKIGSGDSEGAGRLISRAAAIPFDEHERSWPGTLMAEQLLFEFLTDVTEGSWDAPERPEGHESVAWLYDDISRAADHLGSDEGALLRETVETMVADARVLGIYPREARGLAAAARTLPGPALAITGREIATDASADVREETIRRYLHVFVAVMEAMDSHDDARH